MCAALPAMAARDKSGPPANQRPAFFYRMPPRAQRTWLLSEAIERFEFASTRAACDAVATLVLALQSGGAVATAEAARIVAREVCAMAGVAALAVEVKSVRPRNQRGELHGLFFPFDARTRTPPRIVLWMRTAQRHAVVQPRTFVRTLMHELVHYLDYSLLRLGDSHHTMGFFKRESFLVRMLMPPDDRGAIIER